jgi:hypothetical protein
MALREGRGADAGVVGTAFAATVHGVIVVYAFVDDSIGEHGLRRDAEYEDAEAYIVGWFGVFPHICIRSK